MPNDKSFDNITKFVNKFSDNSIQDAANTVSSYTDEQRVLIAKQEYEDYKLGDPVIIQAKDTVDPTDKDITVGYVAEVIHHPTGADVYVVTDVKLPENPTDADRAKVKQVTMLYQGSVQLWGDWLSTDPALAASVIAAGSLSPEISMSHSNTYPLMIGDKTSYNYTAKPHNLDSFSGNSMFPALTYKETIPQLMASVDILNNAMESYPNALFDLYGHSLASSNGQYAAVMCKYPERINSGWFYNGPNIYSLLPQHGKDTAFWLRYRLHTLFDHYDPVGLAYRQYNTVGRVPELESLNVYDPYDQHGWGGYIFDFFGNLIDINGQPVMPLTGIREFDINNDGLADIIFDDFTKQHLFADYSDLNNAIFTNFNLDLMYSPFQFGKIGIDIQLDPELLHTLISNTISNIEVSLSVMLGICSLCIENNSSIGKDKINREQTVYNSIQEVFRGCKIPLILENLNASIEQFKKNSHIFDFLSSPGTLMTEKFSYDETLYSIGHAKYGYTANNFNSQLNKLSNESIKIADLCNAEKCDEISSLSEHQTVVIKSWKIVEDAQKSLLEASNQVFEGNGLRSGRNDAIQQSITDVLEAEEANIKELQNVISNLKTFMTVTTLSFDEKDSYLGTSLQTGTDFSVGASVSGVPQSYEAYLNRSEIFDDVKDVIQAFDMQVERNCKDYAKQVAEIYGETLGRLEHGLETWLELSNRFKNIVDFIYDSFNYPVVVKKRYSFTYTLKGSSYTTYSYKQEFWGELQNLYKSTVVDSIKQAVDKILPLIPIISATINSSKTAKDNLGNIEPELKKIIEDGVYKSIDLMEVVQSQKIVLQLAVKCKLQIRFVIDSINNASMNGKAITTILTKLLQIERLLEYFSTFVSDCFGDNYNEEASSTAPQSSAANFSLNSFT